MATGRIKCSVAYFGAHDVYDKLKAAELQGIPVPGTPQYASSPGIVLLQRKKRVELAGNQEDGVMSLEIEGGVGKQELEMGDAVDRDDRVRDEEENKCEEDEEGGVAHVDDVGKSEVSHQRQPVAHAEAQAEASDLRRERSQDEFETESAERQQLLEDEGESGGFGRAPDTESFQRTSGANSFRRPPSAESFRRASSAESFKRAPSIERIEARQTKIEALLGYDDKSDSELPGLRKASKSKAARRHRGTDPEPVPGKLKKQGALAEDRSQEQQEQQQAVEALARAHNRHDGGRRGALAAGRKSHCRSHAFKSDLVRRDSDTPESRSAQQAACVDLTAGSEQVAPSRHGSRRRVDSERLTTPQMDQTGAAAQPLQLAPLMATVMVERVRRSMTPRQRSITPQGKVAGAGTEQRVPADDSLSSARSARLPQDSGRADDNDDVLSAGRRLLYALRSDGLAREGSSLVAGQEANEAAPQGATELRREIVGADAHVHTRHGDGISGRGAGVASRGGEEAAQMQEVAAQRSGGGTWCALSGLKSAAERPPTRAQVDVRALFCRCVCFL